MKYESLVIDTDVNARNRLKQAMMSVFQFGSTAFVASLKEALDSLTNQRKADVVFISFRFPKEQITQFIKDAKQTKGGQDSAFVMILENTKQDSTSIAQNVLVGGDGMLFEPFSVDSLVEITNVAARVRTERAESRERAAFSFLLNDVMQQLDILASLKSRGFDVGSTHKKLRDMCAVLTTLEPRSLEIYLDLAVEAFEKAPLPKPLPKSRTYSGASSRIKKILEKKIINDLTGETTKPTAK